MARSCSSHCSASSPTWALEHALSNSRPPEGSAQVDGNVAKIDLAARGVDGALVHFNAPSWAVRAVMSSSLPPRLSEEGSTSASLTVPPTHCSGKSGMMPVGDPPAAGRLRSTGITPPHTPLAHPPPSRLRPTSRVAGYRAYLAPVISHRGEEGFSSCSACPFHRAAAITPPKWVSRLNQLSAAHAAFAPGLRARPSEYIVEATCAFTRVTAR